MKKLFIIPLIVLCSCSASWHLQQSKKHEAIAVAKGAVITRDTVYKEVIKNVEVPAAAAETPVKPEIDVATFDATMGEYDSTREYILKLEKELAEGKTLNKEKTMAALRASNAENARLKKRIAQGFSKDSTFTFHADSVMTIWATTKNGLVSSVGYSRVRTELTWKEKIPIYIDQKVKAGFTVVELVGGIIFGIVLGALILGIIIAVRGKNEDHV